MRSQHTGFLYCRVTSIQLYSYSVQFILFSFISEVAFVVFVQCSGRCASTFHRGPRHVCLSPQAKHRIKVGTPLVFQVARFTFSPGVMRAYPCRTNGPGCAVSIEQGAGSS
ncbi:hypothetical protein BDW69DRAFT_141820 [Aspergillus filifer]